MSDLLAELVTDWKNGDIMSQGLFLNWEDGGTINKNKEVGNRSQFLRGEEEFYLVILSLE